MTPFLRTLPILVLSPHSRCNCRCVMCDIWKDTSERQMTAEELASHMDDIRSLAVKWIVFSGGEPLMHPDFFRLAGLIHQQGIKTTVLSTGLLLDRHAPGLVNCVDEVIVSLDGPPEIHDRIRRVKGAFAHLDCGVQALRAASSSFPVMARCTVQKLNHHSLKATAIAARQLGVDSISFLAVDVSSQSFNRKTPWDHDRQLAVALASEEIDRLDEQFDAIDALWGASGFVKESRRKLGRISNYFRALLGETAFVSPHCNAPWVSAVVEADGSVRPCFFHPPIGSLRDRSLFHVLNGFAAQAFRGGLNIETNPTCKRCVCSLFVHDELRAGLGST